MKKLMVDPDCPTKIERPTCIMCALKHLSQAWVLYDETNKGYEEFYWKSMGHMAEAEDELATLFPDEAKAIRDQRKNYEMDDNFEFPFVTMIKRLCDFEKRITEEDLKARVPK